MARAMTIPLAPLKPCRKRKTRKAVMFSDRQAPALAAVKTIMPTSSGSLRPKRSDSGPMKIWPKAMPSIVMVRVSCVSDAEMPKSPPSSGRAGRYISVDSGAIAVMMPRNTVKNSFCFGLNLKKIFLPQITRTYFYLYLPVISFWPVSPWAMRRLWRPAGCRRALRSCRAALRRARTRAHARPAASRASTS